MRLRWAWTLLSTLLLAGWHVTSLSATSVLVVPQHTLKIHSTVTETTAACGLPYPVTGCWDPNTYTLHMTKPESFCDADAVDTAGHEYLHIIGFRHVEDFKSPYYPPESTYGCRNGEFTQ